MTIETAPYQTPTKDLLNLPFLRFPTKPTEEIKRIERISPPENLKAGEISSIYQVVSDTRIEYRPRGGGWGIMVRNPDEDLKGIKPSYTVDMYYDSDVKPVKKISINQGEIFSVMAHPYFGDVRLRYKEFGEPLSLVKLDEDNPIVRRMVGSYYLRVLEDFRQKGHGN